MNLLAIDTSTERASIALLTKGKYYHATEEATKMHAQRILPMIDKLLIDAGMSLSQLDGLVFGQGPGSFTGLRIACSIAKGLAYAQDLPLYPVSTLEAIANEVKHRFTEYHHHALLAVIDARMNQLYWACFTPQGKLHPDAVSAADEIDLRLDYPLILAGVGFESYYPQLPDRTTPELVAQIACYPTASAMIRIVVDSKPLPVSAADALPVYIRNQVIQGSSNG